MPAGRPAAGPELVWKLEGPAIAKERAFAVLQTMMGQCLVIDACDRLGICEQMFERHRVAAVQALIDRLTPRKSGRKKRQVTPEQMEIAQLKEQVARLEAELAAETIRIELAQELPRLDGGPEKKTPRRRGRPRTRNLP